MHYNKIKYHEQGKTVGVSYICVGDFGIDNCNGGKECFDVSIEWNNNELKLDVNGTRFPATDSYVVHIKGIVPGTIFSHGVELDFYRKARR
jgi:hypothetical protein